MFNSAPVSFYGNFLPIYKMHVYALLVWLQLGRDKVRVSVSVKMFSSKCSRSRGNCYQS